MTDAFSLAFDHRTRTGFLLIGDREFLLSSRRRAGQGPGRKEVPAGGRPAARAAPAHFFPPPPARAECRSLSARPCHGACRDRAAGHSRGVHASMRCASDRSTEPMEIISIVVAL